MVHNQDQVNNYFLNYRQVVKKEEKPPKTPDLVNKKQVDNKTTKESLYQEMIATKSTFTERVRSKTAGVSPSIQLKNQNMQLEEHRKRNGPEKYLEPLKIIDIKKWIEQIERVQSIEGKCLETISKCRLYTD